jgi:GNAT superfamily N-acetyltransferase
VSEDYSKISELYKEWVGHAIPDVWAKNGSDFIVAKYKNNIIGGLELNFISDFVWGRKWGLIENVYVKKDYRRNGIGTGLMRYAEVFAKGLGCEFIKLTSRKKEGQALYQSLGYETGMSFYKKL